MYKVLQTFHDAKTLRLVTAGEVVDWTDKERIDAALERGLIEEIKPKKAETKAETAAKTFTKAEPKNPAAKKKKK